jgi:hypothetical protein
MTTTAVDSLVNLRDVAGLPLVGGGTVEPGVLYRGDAPHVGDLAPSNVPSWPPATVVDLRSVRERTRTGFEWDDKSTVHHLPLNDAAAPGDVLPPDLRTLYLTTIDTRADRVARVLHIAVAAAEGPIFVHCTAGKDRTGLVVAALLLAAGVEPQSVRADYLDTTGNLTLLRARWKIKGNRAAPSITLPPSWLTTSPDAIDQVIERLTARPGGVHRWFTDAGATTADLDAWRTRLTHSDKL